MSACFSSESRLASTGGSNKVRELWCGVSPGRETVADKKVQDAGAFKIRMVRLIFRSAMSAVIILIGQTVLADGSVGNLWVIVHGVVRNNVSQGRETAVIDKESSAFRNRDELADATANSIVIDGFD